MYPFFFVSPEEVRIQALFLSFWERRVTPRACSLGFVRCGIERMQAFA